MAEYGTYGDLHVTLDNYVAVAEIRRPPHNYFSYDLIESLASAFEDLGADNACRAIVLCSEERISVLVETSLNRLLGTQQQKVGIIFTWRL